MLWLNKSGMHLVHPVSMGKLWLQAKSSCHEMPRTTQPKAHYLVAPAVIEHQTVEATNDPLFSIYIRCEVICGLFSVCHYPGSFFSFSFEFWLLYSPPKLGIVLFRFLQLWSFVFYLH